MISLDSRRPFIEIKAGFPEQSNGQSYEMEWRLSSSLLTFPGNGLKIGMKGMGRMEVLLEKFPVGHLTEASCR